MDWDELVDLEYDLKKLYLEIEHDTSSFTDCSNYTSNEVITYIHQMIVLVDTLDYYALKRQQTRSMAERIMHFFNSKKCK